MSKDRNVKLDILRGLALLCIIIAHAQPPTWLSQVRNFDVVLMTLLLGCSYYISNQKKEYSYLDHIKKRFFRLVVPTWVFTTIFFIFFYFVSIIRADDFYFELNQIIGSYTMMNGINSIGYIWIMRVFFIVALICPFILRISMYLKSDFMYFTYLFFFYIIYLFLYQFIVDLNGIVLLFYINIVIYGLGYGFIVALGVRLPSLHNRKVDFLFCVFSIISIVLMYHYDFAKTQKFKYPPELYYISYGIFCSLFLYRILDFNIVKGALDNKFIRYISENSAWLYFWHIIFCYFIILFGSSLTFINDYFITRFLFLLLGALVITYLHQYILKKILVWK